MESWFRDKVDLEESPVQVHQIKRFRMLWAFTILCGFLITPNLAMAQLSFVEIMANSVDDESWEWVEVLNSGASAVDLNGYVIDDMNNAIAAPNVSSDLSANTTIPAGGVAVLFDGNGLDYSEQRFRSAWGLDASVPLIGVTNPPKLNNGGDQIGLWSNFDNYTDDLGDNGAGGMEVVRFNNAAARIDFTGDFPSPNDESIYWTGTGDITSAANWLPSADGVAGARVSTATFFESAQINSIEDLANPGVVPAGEASAGLLITEIMYNPKSEDDDFEWVEVYNNTGATIDFGATPYFLDDTSGNAHDAPNVIAGTIADDTAAVLYDSANLSDDLMKAAWGENVNFIGVSNFSSLNNGGDGVGLWTDAAGYATDHAEEEFLDAVSFVVYEDGDNEWPNDNGSASIFLTGLDKNQQVGANWQLADPDDEISRNAMPAIALGVPDHPGGDIGSPGVGPGEGVQPSGGDFNNDGVLDAADIDALTAEVRGGTNKEEFDLNNNAVVDQEDREIWVEQLRGTFFGDSNLDGEFSSADFVSVFTTGLYENDVVGDANWGDGDWNGDGDFSTADFVTAFQSGAYEKGPRQINAVPEPAMNLLLIASAMGLFFARRR